MQQAIIMGRENPFSHPHIPQDAPQRNPFMYFEGWRGASILSPIEKVWSKPTPSTSTPLPSPYKSTKEILMNDSQYPLDESTPRTQPEKRTRRSRKKLTLLSARAICEPIPKRQRENRRHRWTEATRFRREETFHTHDKDGMMLKSSNEKHEGIAQQVLIGWCVFLTLTSMIAIIL